MLKKKIKKMMKIKKMKTKNKILGENLELKLKVNNLQIKSNQQIQKETKVHHKVMKAMCHNRKKRIKEIQNQKERVNHLTVNQSEKIPNKDKVLNKNKVLPQEKALKLDKAQKQGKGLKEDKDQKADRVLIQPENKVAKVKNKNNMIIKVFLVKITTLKDLKEREANKIMNLQNLKLHKLTFSMKLYLK